MRTRRMHFHYQSIITLATLCLASPNYARPDTGCNGTTQTLSFNSGAAWQVCLEASNTGMRIKNMNFKAKGQNHTLIMGEMALAQVVQLSSSGRDQGEALRSNMSSPLLSMANQCEGALYENNRACISKKSGQYLYRYQQYKLGGLYRISYQTAFAPWVYKTEIDLLENGVINIANALGGSPRDAQEQHLSSHYVWRIDFDLGGHDNNGIESILSTPSNDKSMHYLSRDVQSNEFSLNTNKQANTYWRLLNNSKSNSAGKNISYDITMLNSNFNTISNDRYAWLNKNFSVTRYKACELLASQNTCSSDISQYVNGESIDNEDIVLWYRLSQHHSLSDEDRSSIQPKWVQLQLAPRDLNTKNPQSD